MPISIGAWVSGSAGNRLQLLPDIPDIASLAAVTALRPTFETLRPEQRKPNFEVLFDDLLATRRLYEDLRLIAAPADDLINTRNKLHGLRASIAAERAELR